MEEFLHVEASKKIDFKTEIKPYINDSNYFSEYDKFEQSVNTNDPIRRQDEFVKGISRQQKQLIEENLPFDSGETEQ